MRTAIRRILIVFVVVVGTTIFFACGVDDGNKNNSLVGAWRVNFNGYEILTIFDSDGEGVSRYNFANGKNVWNEFSWKMVNGNLHIVQSVIGSRWNASINQIEFTGGIFFITDTVGISVSDNSLTMTGKSGDRMVFSRYDGSTQRGNLSTAQRIFPNNLANPLRDTKMQKVMLPITNNLRDESSGVEWIPLEIRNLAFFSTNNPADGYVDLITGGFDFDFSEFGNWNQFEQDIRGAIVWAFNSGLPQIRGFKPITEQDVRIIGQDSIEVRVSQNISNEIFPRTYTDERDRIVIEQRVRGQNIDTVGIEVIANLIPADSIAPIIERAVFTLMSIDSYAVIDIVDTLHIWFSENIRGWVSSDMIEAKDTNDFPYTIRFNSNLVNGSYVALEVPYNENNSFPVRGDSIRIFQGVQDIIGNLQTVNTVYVPLEIGLIPMPIKFNANVFPSIYNPNNPQQAFHDRNEAIVRWNQRCNMNLNPFEIAVMFRPFRQTGNPLSGNVLVLDAVGNKIVSENIVFCNGEMIWTWNGQNAQGVNVATGVYIVIVNITDESSGITTTNLIRLFIAGDKLPWDR